MSNTVFANKVISSKATELLLTKLNAKNFMTLDTELEGSEGMTRTINTYTYSGEVEELAAGSGNTTRGSISYVGKDYTVTCLQEAFDYLDEDFMKDNKVVDYATKGAAELMSNKLTSKFYAALDTEDEGTPLVGTTTFASGSAISYDVIVDAISAVNLEDESGLFIIIPNAWKADLRKDDDYKSARMGEVVYTGQVGTIAGIPVIATKALTDEAFVLTKEAVTCFIKKAVEVEQDRNKDTRSNAVYLREYYIVALTNAAKAQRIAEAE